VPELGGTVGYELNLFLQDYIGKQGHFWFWFLVWSFTLFFKLKLSRKNPILLRKYKKRN
jgi:S-DNA-T family DNA segregation ATPase FtsK/SpoIIIE